MTRNTRIFAAAISGFTNRTRKRLSHTPDAYNRKSFSSKDTAQFNKKILSLQLRSFISLFKAETAALWFLSFYIFIEYISPHKIYPVLNFLPWGQLSILLALASVFVTGSHRRNLGALDVLFFLISITVVLSGFSAWSPAISFHYWSTYTSWVLMYFCIISILNTSNRMLLFILFFLIINFKLSEHGAVSFALRGFSFAHWGLTGPPGWFRNSGEFAMQMVVVFAIGFSLLQASKKYITKTRWRILLILFPGTALLSVIGSSSRGGQLALAIVILILLFKGKNFFRNILLLLILMYAGLHLLPAKQLERFNTMGDDKTSQLRITHWTHAIQVIEDNPLGIGYYNWIPYYANNFDVVKVEEIHNTVLQVVVELGYPGGFLFLLMVFLSLRMNIKVRRELKHISTAEAEAISAIAQGINLGLIGAFIAALFMSVLFYPVFWFAFALTSALRSISRDITVKHALTQSKKKQPGTHPELLKHGYKING